MLIKLDQYFMKGKSPDFKVPAGCVVAGGAIRRWYSGMKQDSDIDVFAFTESAFLDCTNGLSELLIYETQTSLTFKAVDLIIQVIRFIHPTIENLFDHFDYHHCCWAWDGESIFTTPEAIIATERKSLIIHKPQPKYQLDTLRRAFKYYDQGYHPCMGTYRDLAKMFSGMSDDQINEQFIISPNGGKRINRID